MKYRINDEEMEEIDELVARVFSPKEKKEQSKIEKVGANKIAKKYDALTCEETAEAAREYKAMKKFLANLSDFFCANENYFPAYEALREQARIAWKDAVILEALGFSERREDCQLFYIPITLFNEMIFPMQPLHCLGFLLSRNVLHMENGCIISKRWFRGLKTEFHIINGEKLGK
jgi:hypothetical protein